VHRHLGEGGYVVLGNGSYKGAFAGPQLGVVVNGEQARSCCSVALGSK